MTPHRDIPDQIARVRDLLAEKFGAGGANLGQALVRARPHLPRSVYRRALRLARAEPLARHPKLCITLDAGDVSATATEVCAYLAAIDPADRRKGWWLGMLGGLVFNLLLLVVALGAFMVWRGIL